MEHEEIERFKSEFKPILEQGRGWFGKEVYDNHIKELLKHFGYDVNDKVIKEIFNI